MLHPIDPTVDYAFKRLFGDPANADLLIDFLNAILRPVSPITAVEIINPFNDKEFSTDKLTVVDVKALLADGRTVQVEVQLSIPPGLPERILYTWADIYRAQLAEGMEYTELRAVISIWVLCKRLFKDKADEPPRGPHSHFQAWDMVHGNALTDHLSLHVLELPRFRDSADLDAEARWLYFLKEARHWTQLPPQLDHPVMRKAMAVLRRISDKEREYFAYQARQNFIRDQETTRKLIEQYKAGMERAEAEKEKETADKLRLMEALRAAGIDPAEVLKG